MLTKVRQSRATWFAAFRHSSRFLRYFDFAFLAGAFFAFAFSCFGFGGFSIMCNRRSILFRGTATIILGACFLAAFRLSDASQTSSISLGLLVRPGGLLSLT